MIRCLLLALSSLSLALTAPAVAQHRLAVQGNGRMAIVDRAGKIEWEMKWGPIHDLHVTSNGHFFVQQGAAKVVELDPATKQVVWTYDAAASNGNAGKR